MALRVTGSVLASGLSVSICRQGESNVKTREAPLELSSLRGNEAFHGVIHEAGLQEAFMAIQGLPVKQGLVHGDLKHPNVIIGEGQVYVIDWGEQFFLAPPLFDLLYYL